MGAVVLAGQGHLACVGRDGVCVFGVLVCVCVWRVLEGVCVSDGCW